MRDENRGEERGAAPRSTPVDGSDPDPTRETTAGELERQIESLRTELGELVQELDRRRHEALDVRLQLRRHAGAITVAVTLVGAVVAGRIALRRHRANHMHARSENLARIAGLALEGASAVRGALRGRPESVVLGALVQLAAGVIMRQLHRP